MEGAEDGGGAAGDDGAIISVVAVPTGDTDETSGGSRESAAAVKPLVTSWGCLLYTSPSPRDRQKSRMPSSA